MRVSADYHTTIDYGGWVCTRLTDVASVGTSLPQIKRSLEDWIWTPAFIGIPPLREIATLSKSSKALVGAFAERCPSPYNAFNFGTGPTLGLFSHLQSTHSNEESYILFLISGSLSTKSHWPDILPNLFHLRKLPSCSVKQAFDALWSAVQLRVFKYITFIPDNVWKHSDPFSYCIMMPLVNFCPCDIIVYFSQDIT